MASQKKPNFLKIAFLAGVVLFITYMGVSSHNSNIADDAALTRIKIEFQPVINALEEYHKDNGFYPTSLYTKENSGTEKALVPHYISKIPEDALQVVYGSVNMIDGPASCVKKRDAARLRIQDIDRNATACFSQYRTEHHDTRGAYPLSDLRKYCPGAYPPDYDDIVKWDNYFACVIGYREFQLTCKLGQGVISTPAAYYTSDKKTWNIRFAI